MTTKGDLDKINESAEFLPQRPTPNEDGTRPCLTVAGVTMFAYIEHGGRLVVSLHFDGAGDANSVTESASDGDILGWGLTDEDAIPTLVKIGSGLAVEIDKRGQTTIRTEH